MIEVLCRGKRTDNRAWVEGYYVRIGDYHYILTGKLDIANWYPAFEHYEVIPETVGRYVGITDTRSSKIFEGDIVDTPRWVVAYCADVNDGLGMNAGWYLQRDDFESWCPLENTNDHVVLGNIWDNPELLCKE